MLKNTYTCFYMYLISNQQEKYCQNLPNAVKLQVMIWNFAKNKSFDLMNIETINAYALNLYLHKCC